jgi:hypothetical protein
MCVGVHVRECVCMCASVSECARARVCVRVRVHMREFECECACVCVWVCMFTSGSVCENLDGSTCVLFLQICACVYMCVNEHTRIHADIFTHTYEYPHSHKHTHAHTNISSWCYLHLCLWELINCALAISFVMFDMFYYFVLQCRRV